MNNCTITAIATPPGSGGIGVIKISGSKSASIAAAIFKKANPTPNLRKHPHPVRLSDTPPSFVSHSLTYGYVVDPDSGQKIDEVLLTYMKAPRTYTREDIVEIQAHSGSVGLRAIMEMVLKQGAQLAEPGEFTKRAFLNGRIDLTQAEAVVDVINAKTETALNIATSQLNGKMKLDIESLRNRLTDTLCEIEAGIDFPDDVDGISDPKAIAQTLRKPILQSLDTLIKQYDSADILKDGLRLSVVGRPNVGKSSLLNRLIQRERAIVTAIPGTTRDLIEENFSINGIPIVITDMAGLHQTDDPIEVIGMNKAHESIQNSNLILFMVDSSQALTLEDRQIFERYRTKKIIVVINKIDLSDSATALKLPTSWKAIPAVRISALHDIGIDGLKETIEKLVWEEVGYDPETLIIPNLRHKTALEISRKAINRAIQGIGETRPFELVALDIKEAIDRLGEIMGINVREDILDQIFNRFCIGK
jgi:tRNA modification GTPase